MYPLCGCQVSVVTGQCEVLYHYNFKQSVFLGTLGGHEIRGYAVRSFLLIPDVWGISTSTGVCRGTDHYVYDLPACEASDEIQALTLRLLSRNFPRLNRALTRDIVVPTIQGCETNLIHYIRRRAVYQVERILEFKNILQLKPMDVKNAFTKILKNWN